MRWGLIPALSMLAGPAIAGAMETGNGGSYPFLEVEVVVEVENDHVYDVDDRLLQFSAGYALADGLALNPGWAWVREDGADSYLIGVLMAYEFGFCLGRKNGSAK